MASPLDQFIIEFDKTLQTLFVPSKSQREHPDNTLSDQVLTPAQKRHSIGLMRINHCGEICAQALYQGQKLIARNQKARNALQKASDEEVDHLAWITKRLNELEGDVSFLNPLWYLGSFVIGMTAGLLGDHWSLGFLEETENQVCKHLKSHLEKLPEKDLKSRAIVKQMLIDEKRHAQLAKKLGATKLPTIAKKIMAKSAQLMTTSSYYF